MNRGGICSVICLFSHLWLLGTQYSHSQIAVLTLMFLVQQPEEGTDEWKLLEACKNPKSWVPVHWIRVLENKITFAQTLRTLEHQVSAVKWHFSTGSEILLILLWISWDWSCGNSRVSRWVITTFTACCTCFSQLFQQCRHQWQLACSPMQHTLNSSTAHQLHTVTKFTEHKNLIMHKNNWLTQLYQQRLSWAITCFQSTQIWISLITLK
jgi:hypothetical protein